MNYTDRVLLLAILLLPPCFVQAVDISAQVGAQSRLFTQDGQWQNSIAAETELYWEDSAQINSFALTLAGRYDNLDNQRSYVDIQEALWLHVAADWEFRAGIGKVFWGVTESNHLVDIINQTNLAESIDGEHKLGQAMLHGTLVRDWGVLDAFVLPGFRERIFAGKNGRLQGPVLIDKHSALFESAAQQNHVDYALRYSHSIDAFDVGVSWFKGTNREPLILPVEAATDTESLTGRPYYDQMQQFGLDVQATLGDWLLKLETISRQDSVTDFAAVTTGFEYTVTGVFNSVADMGLLLEYSRDSRNDEATTLLQNDLFFGMRLAFNDMQGTEILFGYVQDLAHQASAMGFIEGSRRLGEAWTLTLDVRTFAGRDPNELLYSLRQDDYVAISLDYYF